MFSISEIIRTNIQMEALVMVSVSSTVEVKFLPFSILYHEEFTLISLSLELGLGGDAFGLVLTLLLACAAHLCMQKTLLLAPAAV